MNLRFWAAALLLTGLGAASAAPHHQPAPHESAGTWLGAWGYPATPLAHGRPDPDTTPPNPPPVVPASLLPVTDAAPTHVEVVPTNQTPDLKNVTLRRTKVTAAGANELQAVLPKCMISR